MDGRAWSVLRGLDPAGTRVRHVHERPARAGTSAEWPAWAHPALVEAWVALGVTRPWQHQRQAADLAHEGRAVVVATGTASGKSLAYQLPVLTALKDGETARDGRGATALYLSPTKALAADQAAALHRLGTAVPRLAVVDGDTPPEQRRWAREHAALVLTNPDLLHHHLLPAHERWAPFLRALRYVVVDECHHYRGVFGAHVAAVLRRLRRLAAHYGADPVVLAASATSADPAGTLRLLAGVEAVAVTADAAPRGRLRTVLWQPAAEAPGREAPEGQHGAAPRRSATTEAIDLLAALVAGGVSTLAFVGSRHGSEVVAARVAERLDRLDRSGAARPRVAAYRGGYLPEDRRLIEAALRSGELTGLATTSALELGIDVDGLDAVLQCGWPGRLSSLWQRAGRAGRRAGDALAVLIARDDPLDTYLVNHPEAVFDRPMDATVLDPDNPYVLAPHLCAAAAELPLRPADLDWFGPHARELVETLAARGALRRRPTGWYWTLPHRASDLADLRGAGGQPVRVVEASTGRLLGTVDAASAHHSVHPGAVHLHAGGDYRVRDLDLEAGVALVEPGDGSVSTQAEEVSDARILEVSRRRSAGAVQVGFGTVEVTAHVTSYVTRDAGTGTTLGRTPLDLPARTLRTRAVWWALPEPALHAAGVPAEAVPGAAHAAEHAAIGLLPLITACDRWDVGGVSTAHHPDTGAVTIVVHDAHPGGAGFAERAFHLLTPWLTATRDAVATCGCRNGCPACVQSPKCGNGNRPLDKAGALRLLGLTLEHLVRADPDPGEGGPGGGGRSHGG
ncbi:MAG: DEAD/DEAH box helicase [Kineosporiaceae bacterium]